MGMGDTLTTEVSRLIQESSCLIGAARLVKPYLDRGKEIVAAYKPEDIRNYIDSHEELGQITVLLSGDSGFTAGLKIWLHLQASMSLWFRAFPLSLICGEDSAVLGRCGASQHARHQPEFY